MVAICRLAAASFLLATSMAIHADYEAEVKGIATAPKVVQAMTVIDSLGEQSIAWLIELTEMPAPPFKEDKRAEFFAYLLREIGLSAEIDAEGNVISRISGSGGETVAVVAHLDTVFPEGTDLRVRQQGNRYCAPGIGDNGRGLVALLAMAEAIISSGIKARGDILLVASVGEEGTGDLRGVRHLFRDGGPKIDHFVAIDGGGASRVTSSAVGSIRYKLNILGPGGHSWGAFGTANPAHALARAIHFFDQSAHQFVNTPGEKVTYNIGRIGGGTSVNSVPFENWAEIDMRSGDPARLSQLDEVLKAAVRRALEEQNSLRSLGAELTVELERIGFRPAGQTAMDSALVQRVSASMRHYGIEPAFNESSTDANVPMSKGVPAVTIGGGGASSGAHSLSECWVDENSAIAVKTALLIVLASAGLAP